jgi:prefoldin subunit 5
MLGNRQKPKTKLDEEIERVLQEMETLSPESDEYNALLKQLERLTKLRKKERPQRRLNPDTLVMVGGNILVALVIVAYEQYHPMTSKAQAFIGKPK